MLLGYARVSTLDQGDGTSLENQERIIRGFAMAKGFQQFDISVYVDSGVSGSIPLSMRPAGKRLLDDAKVGDVVIASKLDRMFRSAKDALDMVKFLRDHKINLVLFDLGTEPLGESAIGKLFFTMVAAFAEFEREIIAERSTGGRRAKKANGGHIGGLPPYGWQVKGEGREAMLVANEKEQEIIVTVKQWLDKNPNMLLTDVTRALDYQGLTARNGKPFVLMQVKRIMDQVQNVPAH